MLFKKATTLQKDEVALVGLNLLFTDKNMANAVSEKVKEIMIKYDAVYCPTWTDNKEASNYIGMLLFSTTEKKDGFYDDAKDILDLEGIDYFVFAKKQCIPEKLIAEAEEFWNEFMAENKKEGKKMMKKGNKKFKN